ncbi:hypothetical protein HELRODRAFT_136785, partial [Helobdella robusta]|uniref:RGS domain-containing protein n=1 Tax=Helobdella robusta TaxID=6412 RepID=T1EIF8_HELRO
KVIGWGVSFDNLLADKEGVQIFMEFLKIEYNQENLVFWLKCEDYKKLSYDEVCLAAMEMYKTHVSEDSMEMVNVDYNVRKKIEHEICQASVHLFHDAQQHIYSLMKEDIYPRFKRSELY